MPDEAPPWHPRDEHGNPKLLLDGRGTWQRPGREFDANETAERIRRLENQDYDG